MNEFKFTGCVEIRELLGQKADDVLNLMEILEDVSLDSIYYHMHSYFLRHSYIVDAYSNDFANWVAIQIRDKVLGERLSAITPWKKKNLEDIRHELIEAIDDYLSDVKVVPSVVAGHPFYFMKSRIIEVPTGIAVTNMHEFKEALKIVDASAIYNHIFEARLRVKKGRSDFAIWFEEALGLPHVAEKIEMIDTYMYSLERLREKLIVICDEAAQ